LARNAVAAEPSDGLRMAIVMGNLPNFFMKARRGTRYGCDYISGNTPMRAPGAKPVREKSVR
jgi:hypothetical protein